MPIKQGGTGATTAEQALKNLGGISITKVWENANPDSAMDAQTISMPNLSGCDAAVICYRNASDSSIYLSTSIIPIGKKTNLGYVTTSGTVYGRPVTVNTSSITLEDGTSGSSNSKKSGIPITVYGVKGVK